MWYTEICAAVYHEPTNTQVVPIWAWLRSSFLHICCTRWPLENASRNLFNSLTAWNLLGRMLVLASRDTSAHKHLLENWSAWRYRQYHGVCAGISGVCGTLVSLTELIF